MSYPSAMAHDGLIKAESCIFVRKEDRITEGGGRSVSYKNAYKTVLDRFTKDMWRPWSRGFDDDRKLKGADLLIPQEFLE